MERFSRRASRASGERGAVTWAGPVKTIAPRVTMNDPRLFDPRYQGCAIEAADFPFTPPNIAAALRSACLMRARTQNPSQ